MNETSTSTAPAEAGGMHIYPPLLALLCFAVTLALHLMLPTERTVYLHHVLGLLLVAGGVGLSFYAAAIFQARDTTKNPYGEPAKFVTTLPYTFTRNPMYVGITAVLLGFAVFFASPVMILAGCFCGRDRSHGHSARRADHGANFRRRIRGLPGSREAVALIVDPMNRAGARWPRRA